MLKNIRLHIEKDEQKQAQLENELANHILKTQQANVNAFQRNVPSLLNYIESTDLANFSLFINQYGEHNIVDYGQGRTIYGFHPEDEVLQQLAKKQQHSPQVRLSSDTGFITNNNDEETVNSIETLPSVMLQESQNPLPTDIECLVVLGCGLGLHLEPLLEQHNIKNIVIYEPELQFFKCSVLDISWSSIFSVIQKKGTSIFLQLGKDGRDLIKDIGELVEHCDISSFHLYKHYNHQVFDSLEHDVMTRSWKDIQDSGFSIKTKNNYLDYVSSWTPNIELKTHTLLQDDNEKLLKNLDALKKYFPAIYDEFKDYTPKKWLPIENDNGEVNLLHIKNLHSWYGDSPKNECVLNFENFDEQPNKDGLVLGYKGTKLAHYIHYQFVKETEELLQQADEEVGALPDKVASIIMFGLGAGYQLEKLLNEHIVEKLFICEPNPDFFYASLFAIDWLEIFETVEKSESRIYLNIGDDGTNLFRDLLNQFYSIGPYILNSTYFYQSYYNASLNSAISQLREQLQVVISMGEYFDHAYYGIAHTKEGMQRNIPILTADPASKLSYDNKEVPIFIVGNGPSLDSSIDAIKEWQGQSIIISCGTALQALHRHNITPDFHAEIEQNRSTFDWAVLVGDLDYLKEITLISCNGVHPDTCELYKDVMVAFKEGESSTVSALTVLGRENYEVLQNAFPTVSNFVCDLFSCMGFTSIYLIGVDLGFVSVKHHHSKSSGYYQEDGEETYDYSAKNNTSIVVPGNFRPTVNTKHEFKVSRQVIEQVTAKKPKGQSFYNCSDGAKIQGTLPIRPDDLLIVATLEQKQQTLDVLKTKVFSSNGLENYSEKFERQFSQELLLQEISAFETLLEKEITCTEDVQFIIDRQKEMLFTSYKTGKSLLFYYLYGTVNYANAALTKLLSNINASECDEGNNLFSNNVSCISFWANSISTIRNKVSTRVDELDISSYFMTNRELKFLQQNFKNETFLIVTESEEFEKIANYVFRKSFPWFNNVSVCTFEQSQKLNETPDYCLYDIHQDEYSLIKGKVSTVVITNDLINNKCTSKEGITQFLVPEIGEAEAFTGLTWIIGHAIRASVSFKAPKIIIPKYYSVTSNPFIHKLEPSHSKYFICDYGNYVCCYQHENELKNFSLSGSRGEIEYKKLDKQDFLHPLISHEKLQGMRQKISKKHSVILDMRF
ncbi:6-hydroxymethylpterin diphosphokinase MptE-like protein [Paraglaciecola marina]|uniref:6-hydroxymethylpterin diphosphokinase MptE-like protein n=1 Tax=Paraglaciecola marina TaxID=2500157 RepID=UPI00105F50A5|nr:6-hydroxymethylpterin diphosphokinase MptE-like protein [Paraglaciecola marina]